LFTQQTFLKIQQQKKGQNKRNKYYMMNDVPFFVVVVATG
jgi:hypothetical protein